MDKYMDADIQQQFVKFNIAFHSFCGCCTTILKTNLQSEHTNFNNIIHAKNYPAMYVLLNSMLVSIVESKIDSLYYHKLCSELVALMNLLRKLQFIVISDNETCK